VRVLREPQDDTELQHDTALQDGTEAGFTLIEVLVAAALFAVVAIGAFEVVRQLAVDARALTARHLAYGSLERVSAQLRAEARTATAIWSSSPSAGAGHDDCIQVDFFTADAAGPTFWSYRSFPNHTASDAIAGDVLERIAGRAPLAACDPNASGSIVLGGLRAPLGVATIAANTLAAHRDVYLGAVDSAFVAASVPATPPVELGVLDASGSPVRGGNGLVELRLDTADGSRVVDLVAGVFPNGFTEVLRYTCNERCDVGHDVAAPKTLTSCSMTWQPGWSTYVTWSDFATNPDGSLTFPGGWFIGGTFTFTNSGTRASDGGIDTLAKPYAATNWDVSRDYAAYPPDRPAADGSRAGSFAPWDVRAESPSAWMADFAPYLAAAENAPIAAEKARCDAVQSEGASGGFYANG
jgi:prepilin-type N-terminal cleavage/methylation domain-containing protein